MEEKVIFSLGGLVIGFLAGWFIGRKLMKKKVDKEIDDRVNHLMKNFEKTVKEEEKAEEEKVEKLFNDAVKVFTEYSDNTTYPDPAEMMAPEEDDDEDLDEVDRYVKDRDDLIRRGGLVTEENENDIAGEELTEEMKRAPKIISAEEFDNGKPEYDKVQLIYYTDDDVLIEESTDEEVFDIPRTVGDALDKFGFRDPESDEEVIFVRNFAFGIDYEISKLHTNFYDTDH